VDNEDDFCYVSNEYLDDLLAQVEGGPIYDPNYEENKVKDEARFTKWTSGDNTTFYPTSKSFKALTAGLYIIERDRNRGIYFEKVKFSTESLVEFPETNSEKVINDIKTFWSKEEIFKKYNRLPFRRGILLYGPPGGGKTSTLKFIVKDVVEKLNGVILKMDDPYVFEEGLRIFRDVEPDRHIVVTIEDIDSLIEEYRESTVLNILDGLEKLEKILFLATTNYPEKLSERIINRPSRFDVVIKIPMPNEATRKVFLESLIESYKEIINDRIDIDIWVADTDSFSVGHIEELFRSVIIFDNDYEDVIKILHGMYTQVTSEHDGERMGLGKSKKTAGFGKKSRSRPLEDDEEEL